MDVKRTIVKALRPAMTLKKALKYMEFRKSSYCYKKRTRSEDKRVVGWDPELTEALRGMTGYELTLGYHKTTDYLRTKYTRIWNHKKLYRHMKALSLLQPRRIKRLWRQNKRLLAYCPLQSNVRWEADLTYVPTRMGTVYLFVIEDVYDREVLAGEMGVQAGAKEAVTCLEKALIRRFGQTSAPGLALNSAC